MEKMVGHAGAGVATWQSEVTFRVLQAWRPVDGVWLQTRSRGNLEGRECVDCGVGVGEHGNVCLASCHAGHSRSVQVWRQRLAREHGFSGSAGRT